MEIKVKVKDLKTGKEFYKYFETEFEKDKYIRRSRHFTKIRIIDECKKFNCD